MRDLILEIPNFIPNFFCNHLIQKFELDNRKTDGVVIYDGKESVISDLKHTKDLSINRFCGWESEVNYMRDYIKKAVNEYYIYLSREFKYDQTKHTFHGILDMNLKDCGLVIQCQYKSPKNAWHYDGGIGLTDFVRILVYLNTLNSGETEFGNGRKVKPECGKILIWPASWTYPHCGNEVVEDSKYILTTTLYKLN